MHPKLKGSIWILGTCGLVFLFILSLPILAKSLPWSVEKKMGNLLDELPDTRICKSKEGQQALAKIVARLVPVVPGDEKFPVTVKVIAGNTVNAFAFLGGQIYVYDGLLQKTESADELAGVLAHEIEHVRHRHIIQGVFVRFLTYDLANIIFDRVSPVDPRLLHLLMNLQFSREQETEADIDGLKRLQWAKIDTNGFARFFKREESRSAIPTLLSDHPSSENRSELAMRFNTRDPLSTLNATEWEQLRKICAP